MVQEKNSYNLILDFACYISLVINLLPVVDYYCPWFITVIPFLLLLFVTIKSQRDFFMVLELLFVIVLIALLEFWVVYRNNDLFNFLMNFVISFLPVIFAVQVKKEQTKISFYKNYIQFAAICIGITAVTTIIGLNKFPSASRELASGTAIWDTTIYTKMNIGGYQYIYSLIVFVPILICLIKNTKGVTRFLNIVILIFLALCVYESQYTIALLMLILSFVVVWICSIRNKSRWFLFLLLVLILIGGSSLLSLFFEWLSNVIEKEYVSDRLLQVSQLLAGKTISTDTSTERIEHYQHQIQAFFSSPLWGFNLINYNSNYISGHSTILDVLGGGGIFTFSILLILIRKMYVGVFGEKTTSKYVEAVWIMFVITSILNPVIFPTILFVVFMCAFCMSKYEEILS